MTWKSAQNGYRAAALAAALSLGGCAGDVPVPFMDLSLPSVPVIPANHPSNQPAPAFPAIAPPAEREDDTPTMNDVERTRLEDQLKKLANEREANVKKRIEQSN